MRAVGVMLGGGSAGVRLGVKATFRFKITFSSFLASCCAFPDTPCPPPLPAPRGLLWGAVSGVGFKHILGSFNAASLSVRSLG